MGLHEGRQTRGVLRASATEARIRMIPGAQLLFSSYGHCIYEVFVVPMRVGHRFDSHKTLLQTSRKSNDSLIFPFFRSAALLQIAQS